MRAGMVAEPEAATGRERYSWSGNGGGHRPLAPHQQAAAREVIRRVRYRVPAELAYSVLFGSRARGDARPDSDVDILLIFRELPPDREPQAGQAEQIADDVAAESGVPVATWSVSLVDLELGKRTPMLVDALDDGVPLWPPRRPSPRVTFTPWDALRCTDALLARVAEGSDEVAGRRAAADHGGAARRARGDVVRLCTAALLLDGETRPRRGDAVRRFLQVSAPAEELRHTAWVLEWAASSYGPDGHDEERPVELPPGGLDVVGEAIDHLVDWVERRRVELAARVPPLRNLATGARI